MEHYREERPLEYARRLHDGTLNDVLVEKRITWRTYTGDVLWWIITAFAGFCAILMTVFVIWSVFD